MDWEPITIADYEILGTVSGRPGLLDVRLHLSAPPPPKWREFFRRPVGTDIFGSIQPPKLEWDRVVIMPPKGDDDALEDYVVHVRERISAANKRYESEVIPQMKKKKQRRKEKPKEREQAIKRADEKLDDLL